MKLVNGPSLPQQLTDGVTPSKSKEIIIISHIYDYLTTIGLANKKAMLPRKGFFIF